MAIINGTAASDQISGTQLNDVIHGLDGDDVLRMANGNDLLYGDAGNDVLYADNGQGLLSGGDGNDRFVLFTNECTVDGGTTDLPGALFGWQEIDTVEFVNQQELEVDLLAGTATFTENSEERVHLLSDIEKVIGTNNDDILLGGNVSNDDLEIFVGRRGVDFIDGKSGWDVVDYFEDDNVYGLPVVSLIGIIVDLSANTARDSFGNNESLLNIEEVRGAHAGDLLFGNEFRNKFLPHGGSDVVDGKGGSDTISYILDHERGGVRGIDADLSLGLIRDTSAGIDTVTSVESVQGSIWGDRIVGSSAANILNGQSGADLLKGMASNDTLRGGEDTDFLFGGTGRDKLSGGSGHDELRGGGGVDIFIVDQSSDVDVLLDFKTGVDKIDLRAFGFTSATEVLDAVRVVSGSRAVINLGNDTFLELNDVNTSGAFIASGDLLI